MSTAAAAESSTTAAMTMLTAVATSLAPSATGSSSSSGTLSPIIVPSHLLLPLIPASSPTPAPTKANSNSTSNTLAADIKPRWDPHSKKSASNGSSTEEEGDDDSNTPPLKKRSAFTDEDREQILTFAKSLNYKMRKQNRPRTVEFCQKRHLDFESVCLYVYELEKKAELQRTKEEENHDESEADDADDADSVTSSAASSGPVSSASATSASASVLTPRRRGLKRFTEEQLALIVEFGTPKKWDVRMDETKSEEFCTKHGINLSAFYSYCATKKSKLNSKPKTGLSNKHRVSTASSSSSASQHVPTTQKRRGRKRKTSDTSNGDAPIPTQSSATPTPSSTSTGSTSTPASTSSESSLLSTHLMTPDANDDEMQRLQAEREKWRAIYLAEQKRFLTLETEAYKASVTRLQQQNKQLASLQLPSSAVGSGTPSAPQSSGTKRF